MALKAGYYGVKKAILDELSKLDGAKIIKSIGAGLNLSSQGALSCKIGTAAQKGIVQVDDTTIKSDDGLIRVDTDILSYGDGESISIPTDIPIEGYITNGAKEIWLQIPTHKGIRSNTATLLTEGVSPNVTVRGVGGYVLQNGSLTTLSASFLIRNGFLILKIMNSDSSAFTATNNTPVSAQLANVTIEFSTTE